MVAPFVKPPMAASAVPAIFGTANALREPGQSAIAGTAPAGQIFGDENTLDIVRGNGPAAIAAYRRARGQTGRDKSLYGDFREARMGQALQALLAMLMPPDGSDQSLVADPLAQANALAGKMIGDLTAGRGFGGVLRQQAAALPSDLSGYDDKQILAILGAQNAAANIGYGDFGQMATNNAYADLEHIAQQYGLQPNYDPNSSAIAGSQGLAAFQRLMDQYLASR